MPTFPHPCYYRAPVLIEQGQSLYGTKWSAIGFCAVLCCAVMHPGFCGCFTTATRLQWRWVMPSEMWLLVDHHSLCAFAVCKRARTTACGLAAYYSTLFNGAAVRSARTPGAPDYSGGGGSYNLFCPFFLQLFTATNHNSRIQNIVK